MTEQGARRGNGGEGREGPLQIAAGVNGLPVIPAAHTDRHTAAA